MDETKSILIHDICEISQMTEYLGHFLAQVDLRKLPVDTLLDLRCAHSCLYLAIENALIEEARTRRND